jgi:hypothetical protein
MSTFLFSIGDFAQRAALKPATGKTDQFGLGLSVALSARILDAETWRTDAHRCRMSSAAHESDRHHPMQIAKVQEDWP